MSGAREKKRAGKDFLSFDVSCLFCQGAGPRSVNGEKRRR